jgi:hypothetical protein
MRNVTTNPFTTFNHSKYGQSIRISGRSFYSNCIDNTASTPASYGSFTNTSGSADFYTAVIGLIQPNYFNTNLESIAECFQKYRFTRLELEYEPACSTTINGGFVMTYIDDPAPAAYNFPDAAGTDAKLSQNMPNIFTPYWRPAKLTISKPDRVWLDVYPPYSVSSMTYADWRQVIQGAFLAATSVSSGTLGGILGRFFFNYTLELTHLTPQIPGPTLSSSSDIPPLPPPEMTRRLPRDRFPQPPPSLPPSLPTDPDPRYPPPAPRSRSNTPGPASCARP